MTMASMNCRKLKLKKMTENLVVQPPTFVTYECTQHVCLEGTVLLNCKYTNHGPTNDQDKYVQREGGSDLVSL
jgi:hypothetical protein